jgi:hypothetical protein
MHALGRFSVAAACACAVAAVALPAGARERQSTAARVGHAAGNARIWGLPPVRRPDRFVLVAGGDIALSGELDEGTLSGIARFLHPADLAIGNLEGTLTTTGSARCVADAAAGCFVFRGSPSWSGALRRVGFTALNVANNHALDFGAEGQRQTLAALRRAGIAYDGLPGQITYLHPGGVSVAVIGVAPYPWAQELLDTAGTQRLVRRAARHADVVIVYMHAGAEGEQASHVTRGEETYLGERRGNPVAFAHAMVDAGADLVFASGPHVLRGLQWYRGRLIAYSLGNLAGTNTLSTAGLLADSALLHVILDARGRVVAGSLIPLRLDARGTPSYDGRRASLDLMRRLSKEDFGGNAVRISATGKLATPTPKPPSLVLPTGCQTASGDACGLLWLGLTTKLWTSHAIAAPSAGPRK